MKFGPVPVGEAEGAILAHAAIVGDRRLKKGHRITAADIASWQANGVGEVVAAVLAPGDVGEDEAATRIVAALVTRGIDVKPAATGRVNLHARSAGIFTVDPALIDAINAVDPAITIATVQRFARLSPGQMTATVKIIPFAVAGDLVDAVVALCHQGEAFAVEPFRPARVSVVQTVLPGVKPSVLDKTARITKARLERSGSTLAGETRTAHGEDELARAIGEGAARSDLVLVFGASAVSDSDDVIPAAIRLAGGEVERFGMPVDPGNLLVLGRVGATPVLGAPGCARSPKENGFDWILDRILAGIPATGANIALMGVGGLLMEIPTRPQPREKPPAIRPTVHAVLLAAGRSSRMGGPNKLMADFEGAPLVRWSATKAMESKVAGAVAVVGHQAERVRAALDGLSIRIIDNPAFAEGLSTSLKAGIAALPAEATGALVMLSDMPAITAADLDRLVEAFEASGGTAIVRATHGGKRGNPVILPRSTFAAIEALQGDTGARHIVEGGLAEVIDVEIGAGASLDVDTPEALREAGGVLQG